MTNGTVYRTSRYRTLRAENQRPTARAVPTANMKKAGKSMTAAIVGVTRYHAIIPSSNTNDNRKSNIGVRTDAIGITIRGKYTFRIRLASLTRLTALRVIASVK